MNLDSKVRKEGVREYEKSLDLYDFKETEKNRETDEIVKTGDLNHPLSVFFI